MKKQNVTLYKKIQDKKSGTFYIKDNSPIIVDGCYWHPDRMVKARNMNNPVFRFSTGIELKLKTVGGKTIKIKGKLEAHGIKQATEYKENYLRQKELKLKELTDIHYQEELIRQKYEGRNPVKLMKTIESDSDGLLELYIKKRQSNPNPEKRVTNKTIESYKNSFTALVSRIGNKYIDQYTFDDCLDFVNIILKETPRRDSKTKVKDLFLKKVHNDLEKAFKWAIDPKNGVYLKENHWATTELKSQLPNLDNQRRASPFTADEFWKIHSALTRDNDKGFIEFMFYTGMRVMEVENLKVNDINIESKYIDINITKPCSVPRMIPLPPALIPIINKAIKNDQTYVFEQPRRFGTDKRICKHGLSDRFRAVKDSILGKDCKKSLYDVRATFGSLLQQSGYSIYKVSQLMGHKHLSTTQKYYLNASPIAFTDSVTAMDKISKDSLTRVLIDSNTENATRLEGKWKHQDLSFLKQKINKVG